MNALKNTMLTTLLIAAPSFANAFIIDSDDNNHNHNLGSFSDIDSEFFYYTGTNISYWNSEVIMNDDLFNDNFHFTLTQETTLNQEIGFSDYFSFMSLTLFDDDGNLLATETFNNNSFTFGYLDPLSLSSILPAGDYTTTISARSPFPGDTMYDFKMNAILTPVPEASTITMILGGLGLVGFMAARRKNTKLG